MRKALFALLLIASAALAAWPPGLMSGANWRLSGESVSHTAVDPADATATLRVDADGNVYSVRGVTETQLDTVTDWVRPASESPGNLQVRFTNLVGHALTSSTAVEDAWHSLSSGDFTLTLSRTVLGTVSATFDVEIRSGGSGAKTLASGSYTLTAEVAS